MRRVPVHDLADCAADEIANLTAAVDSLRTLADVLAWARSTTPVATIVEIITQDEYTHDVVLERAGEPYLAFDTT
jgi:hypothetical protein